MPEYSEGNLESQEFAEAKEDSPAPIYPMHGQTAPEDSDWREELLDENGAIMSDAELEMQGDDDSIDEAPDTLIHDKEMAVDMAYASKPFMDMYQDAVRLEYVDVAESMLQRAEEAETSARTAYENKHAVVTPDQEDDGWGNATNDKKAESDDGVSPARVTQRTTGEADRLPHAPTKEQLSAGYELGPAEMIYFEAKPSVSERYQTRRYGDGQHFTGQSLAHLRFGGDRSFVEAFILKGVDSQEEGADHKLIIYPPGEDAKSFGINLEKGKMIPLGRNFVENGVFPNSVSREHCAIGMDNEGHFVLENYRPANATFIQVYEANQV